MYIYREREGAKIIFKESGKLICYSIRYFIFEANKAYAEGLSRKNIRLHTQNLLPPSL